MSSAGATLPHRHGQQQQWPVRSDGSPHPPGQVQLLGPLRRVGAAQGRSVHHTACLGSAIVLFLCLHLPADWLKLDDDKVSMVTEEDILKLSGGGMT